MGITQWLLASSHSGVYWSTQLGARAYKQELGLLIPLDTNKNKIYDEKLAHKILETVIIDTLSYNRVWQYAGML